MSTTEERLIRTTQRERPEDVEKKRVVKYLVCAVCGAAKWSSSIDSKEGFRVEIERFTHQVGECRTCDEIFRRHPELVPWILRLLAWHDEVKPPITF